MLNENEIINKIISTGSAEKSELVYLIENVSDEGFEILRKASVQAAKETFGNGIFIRGLIEFTNYCVNDCYYCGIRAGNSSAVRYRMLREEILKSCDYGYGIGIRSFVLQGGEDPYYTDEILADIILHIKDKYPDCAVTLSVGERSKESYRILREAGADRYLLRHETASCEHYRKLHPESQTLENRIRCLYDLKELGYQTGAGFMVGSPYQRAENLAEDLLFLKELNPHMVGIGPFIPHRDTPFKDEPGGDVRLTLLMIMLVRLILRKTMIPATTALNTADGNGRIKGILAGANVIMPNITPDAMSRNYELYNKKKRTGDECGENIPMIADALREAGYELSFTRGDSPLI